MNILQNILGGGQQQQDYRDYVNRYEQGHPSEGYSDQEVMNRYQQIAPQLSPQQYQQAAQQSFERMSPQERMQFGQYMQQQARQQGYQFPDANRDGIDDRYQDPNYLAQTMTQMRQQQPDMLHQILGPGGALGNPMAKAAVAGIAALAAKQFLGR